MNTSHKDVLDGLHGGRAGGSMGDTIIIDNPLDETRVLSMEEINKTFHETLANRLNNNDDIKAVAFRCSFHNNKNDDMVDAIGWAMEARLYGIDSTAWTGLNGTNWHLPRRWEMSIIVFISGFAGMTLSFILFEYIGG